MMAEIQFIHDSHMEKETSGPFTDLKMCMCLCVHLVFKPLTTSVPAVPTVADRCLHKPKELNCEQLQPWTVCVCVCLCVQS